MRIIQSIAIIDDDDFACKRLEKLLKQSFPKAKIFCWIRPLLALEQIRSETIDLLFLDVEMPEISGIKLLERLRKIGYKGKVIFTTAFDHYILKALRAGAFDYLLKPIDVDELNEALIRYNSVQQEKNQDFDSLVDKGLSSREIDVIKLIFEGLSSKQISDKLFIAKSTVDKHRANILEKTGCKNTTQLFMLL